MTEIKIIQEIENPLFSRKEIQFEIDSEITPSHEEIIKLISEKFSTDASKIKIHKIEGKFGVKKFLIIVDIYNSKEDKESYEIKTKKQREAEKKSREEEAKKLAEEKKKAEEEKAAKAESEKPIEESKEENSEEKTE